MKIRKIIWTSNLVILLGLSLYLSYTINLDNINTNLLKLLTNSFLKQEKTDMKFDVVSWYLSSLKDQDHFKETFEIKDKTEVVTNIAYNTDDVLVYIYNTHSNEEYAYLKNDIYNIVPNVKTASYILEEELKKLGITSLVEKENTIDIVNKRGLAYSNSYKVSRELMEKQKLANPSLTYFIDLHRDSVSRKTTTVEIGGVSYAKTMFLLGLENENYQENKKLMQELNNYLETNYPGLSRGIYEKQGAGVDGVYNQDFNAKTILIEVGGVDNTILEVNESIKVIANMLAEYINKQKNA